MHTVIVKAQSNDAGQRIDIFLASKLDKFSRAQIGYLIKNALVSINAKPVKASYKIVGIERITVHLPEPQSSHLQAEALPLDILYSDDEIAVINKPKGMVVHPGAGVKTGTLCHALLYHFPSMVIGNQERPGIVHRLDKDTSGVMVVAKTQHALQILSQEFKDRRVIKIYRALAYGHMRYPQFELKTGHVRHPHHRLKFFTGLSVPETTSTHVRFAHSSFKVRSQNYGICALAVKLHTGRTHQIRAHLADINHPLLGDHLYGGVRTLIKGAPPGLVEAINALEGQVLHAETIEFLHPKTKEMMSFNAPLTQELLNIEQFLQA